LAQEATMTAAAVEEINPHTGEVRTLVAVGDPRSPTATREAKALDYLNDRGHDLADLSDDEFERGLKRLELAQKRAYRILDTVLVENVHYGNPKSAFKHKILLQPGAQEVRRLMRLKLSRTREDVIISTPEYCEVTVVLGIFDAGGRFIVERRGTCNSKEKTFKAHGGKGWIYEDARELLHTISARAEKRAAGLCTLEASGLTGFLANEDEMEAEMKAEADKPITPWTEAEKKKVYDLCTAKGLGRNRFAKLVMDAIGRPNIGTGHDADLVYEAVKAWEPPAKTNQESAPSAPSEHERPATAGQIEVVRKILKSHVITDQERADIEAELAANPSADRVGEMVAELSALTKERKAAEKAQGKGVHPAFEPGDAAEEFEPGDAAE